MPSDTTEAAQRAAPVPSRLFGWAMVLSSTLAFSFSSPLATILIRQGVDPTTMLVARFAMTISVMAVSIAVSAPARFFMPRRSLGVALAAGLINSISILSFFWSLTRLSTPSHQYFSRFIRWRCWHCWHCVASATQCATVCGWYWAWGARTCS
ncbi:hypothetical protein EMGBS3_13870 [Anaerolineaceae bacterium]|nr:hypothetical protein EMGBS3_13870 [Anaerolineaceae bacterium]